MKEVEFSDLCRIGGARGHYVFRVSQYYPDGGVSAELLDEKRRGLLVLSIRLDTPPPDGCFWLYHAEHLELLVRHRLVEPNPEEVYETEFSRFHAHRLGFRVTKSESVKQEEIESYYLKREPGGAIAKVA